MLLLVLLSVLVAVRGETSLVNQCLNNEGDMPINTYVSGCTRMPCELPQLQMARINVIFKAPRTIRSMRTLASASVVLGGNIMPAINYPLGAAEVTCDYITNTYCPLMEGEVVQYTLNMFIEFFFPVNTNANVEFYAVDENNLPVFCLQMSVRIVRASDSKASAAVNGTDTF